MLYDKLELNQADSEQIERLKDFIPDKIFDAHCHVYDSAFMHGLHPEKECGKSIYGVDEYRKSTMPILNNPRVLKANYIIYPDPCMADKQLGVIELSDEFLKKQLDKDTLSVGEIIVNPLDTAEEIEKRLTHKGIRGLKCYHFIAKRDVTWNLNIDEYLPESAWEVANKHKLVITLHMVKDLAASDPENFNYIVKMAKKYPDAKLILAHCARSFASWTVMEPIKEFSKYDNIWYDFSGICEPVPMMAILKQLNGERCMWGTDSPVSNMRGRAVSFADGFHWFYDTDFIGKDMSMPKKFFPVGIEALMAVKQACDLLDLTPRQVEDLMYNNADKLWK